MFMFAIWNMSFATNSYHKFWNQKVDTKSFIILLLLNPFNGAKKIDSLFIEKKHIWYDIDQHKRILKKKWEKIDLSHPLIRKKNYYYWCMHSDFDFFSQFKDEIK